ncbi:MAG: alpha/beta hydrolase, partial [Ilumatobacter sp.]|nr:alpha/beta hydrolase [Ilumatobacter sp.]
LVHAAVVGVGWILGGTDNLGGLIGVWLLAFSALLLVWVMLRTIYAVWRLRHRIEGSVRPPRGLATLVGRPVPAPDGVRERLHVEWREGLTADLTTPARHDCRLPVVVYVHGGGWTSGDPQRQARDLYHELALAGWAVLAIRYPLAPHVGVEHQVEVVRAAVRWTRADLAEHGVEATHVVLAGGSAGAHLASTAALTAEHPSERVEACVALYGIFDMANRNRTRAPWGIIPNTVMQATVAQAPNRYRDLSPLDRITDSSPPFLVVHGTRDTLVPVGEAEQFVAALREANRPVEFVPVVGAQHAFDALSSPTTRATAAVIRTWLHRRVATGAAPRT